MFPTDLLRISKKWGLRNSPARPRAQNINLQACPGFNIIPYLDLFIDCCKSVGCSASINKQLLLDLDIIEHFRDRVQIY